MLLNKIIYSRQRWSLIFSLREEVPIIVPKKESMLQYYSVEILPFHQEQSSDSNNNRPKQLLTTAVSIKFLKVGLEKTFFKEGGILLSLKQGKSSLITEADIRVLNMITLLTNVSILHI